MALTSMGGVDVPQQPLYLTCGLRVLAEGRPPGLQPTALPKSYQTLAWQHLLVFHYGISVLLHLPWSPKMAG